jgi:hypothetical protein
MGTKMYLSIIELVLSIISITGAFYFAKLAFSKPSNQMLCLSKMSNKKIMAIKTAAVLLCIQLAFSVISAAYWLMGAGKMPSSPMTTVLSSAFR